MKKGLIIFLIFFALIGTKAQQTKPVVAKDTVKTEVVEVITTYNPEIADANKIHKNPVIKLSDKSKKKKLTYNIFSAPVASTFIPKSGVVKGIDVGVKERIYDNYIAAGFGNFTSPYFEAYLHNYTRFESEIGVSLKYQASLANIENTDLDSDFSNLLASVSYEQEERYFDWKFILNTELNNYNWYGLQENSFAPSTIQNIEENQAYKFFNATGEIDFLDSYIDKSVLSLSYFMDDYNSSEFFINLNTNFDLPIDFISRSLNNLQLKTSLELLNGEFKSNYTSDTALKYSIFTAKVNPEYNTTFSGFSIKLGAKLFGSFDAENNVNNVLVYPDVKIQKSIISETLNAYVGVFGDFKTNTYKKFTEENPYVSPTLFITQTAEKYNAFLGFNGVINNDLSFNISASYKEEQDKALFIRNNSKSDGTNNFINGVVLQGFEYGNSFNLVYDDVKTTSFLAELEYDLTKRITLSTNVQFDNYTMTSQFEAWNLPTIQAAFIGKYNNNKWYATTNIFYIGDRKDVIYESTSPSAVSAIQTLDAFVDVNLNGGYHFNDKFSAFLRFNNILNSDYQRFANFNVQGFQVLGGVTYKFDF
ncbi:hypothetical protein BW723_01980 [Polaribacter reichenbachii]|uniref:TonB-dependent receptor n=1 Tax=Polaribacter reichenbachii TaxID=996801 RepID=A0A1B8TWA6_9FLAO|nr:TonB-dependent receptor [Polaribacter reichenbachii]APZ45137.1 hypothetical protein BW723_01980 [Polaribacter reichenbachii]AUC18999.1 hypothetical protein BTO17_09980 [Polaribacter reichenbachii]OBY63844.1 hypothetical protein LPB301_13720 [Polaribacter reichenbachii]